MTPTTEVVEVIIPVYNQIEHVSTVLTSLFTAEESSAFEVTVIDDCSTDQRVVELLRTYADTRKIHLHVNETNLGFTGSVCVGMTLRPDRDVVLLNSDTEVYSHWLTRLRKVFSEKDMVCSVSPFSNHSSISSYPIPFTDNSEPLEIAYEELAAIVAIANDGLSCETLTTSGFCMYISRVSLNAIGLFDKEAFPRGYGEETDFCIRARKMGWSHYVAADVFVRHASSASFGDEKHALNACAIARLFYRHPEYRNLANASAKHDRLRDLRARIDYKRVQKLASRFRKVEFTVRTNPSDQLNVRDDTCYLICTETQQGLSEVTLWPHIDVPNIPILRLVASDFELRTILHNLPVNGTEISVVSKDRRTIAFEWVQRVRNAIAVSPPVAAVPDPAFAGEVKVARIDEVTKRYVGAVPCIGRGVIGQQELTTLFFELIKVVQPDVFLTLGINKDESNETVRKLLPQCDVRSFEIALGIRIDTFLRKHDLQGRLAVWIDCEGTALEVLGDFGEVLGFVDIIYIELESSKFWKGQAPVPEVFDFLIARGFEPLIRDAESGEWQFNCVFVRNSLAASAADLIRTKEMFELGPMPAQGPSPATPIEQTMLEVEAIPILVPCFNNATYCDSMLRQLISLGFKNITFVDNCSTALSMLKWLESVAEANLASIETTSENIGPVKSIFTPERLESLPRWFCVTDPDLRFNKLLPDGWLDELTGISQRFHAGKVGFALNVSDKTLFRSQEFDIGGRKYHIWDWEEQFWRHEIGRTRTGDSVYYSQIDTTFAIYDQNFFDVDNFLDGIRVGGRYTSLHLPWYKETCVPQIELDEYKLTQRYSYYYR